MKITEVMLDHNSKQMDSEHSGASMCNFVSIRINFSEKSETQGPLKISMTGKMSRPSVPIIQAQTDAKTLNIT